MSVMYELGDLLPLSVSIGDFITGLPADPGGIACSVTLPNGTVVSVLATDIVRSGVGEFYTDFPATMSGRYLVNWVATAPNPGVFRYYSSGSCGSGNLGLSGRRSHWCERCDHRGHDRAGRRLGG